MHKGCYYVYDDGCVVAFRCGMANDKRIGWGVLESMFYYHFPFVLKPFREFVIFYIMPHWLFVWTKKFEHFFMFYILSLYYKEVTFRFFSFFTSLHLPWNFVFVCFFFLDYKYFFQRNINFLITSCISQTHTKENFIYYATSDPLIIMFNAVNTVKILL